MPAKARVPGWLVPCVLIGAVLVVLVFFVAFAQGSGRTRLQKDHGISLPASANQMQAHGMASVPVFEAIDLPRSAAGVVVMTRTDLELFLEQFDFDWTDDNPVDVVRNRGGRVPAHEGFGDDSVPWSGTDAFEVAYGDHNPGRGAQTTLVLVYGIDNDTVGVFLYTEFT